MLCLCGCMPFPAPMPIRAKSLGILESRECHAKAESLTWKDRDLRGIAGDLLWNAFSSFCNAYPSPNIPRIVGGHLTSGY